MSVPNQALNHLIEHLKQLAVHNPHLIADVKENIEKLQLELEFLRSMMRDFSRAYSGSSYLMQTMKGIRSVIDEAEDAVDAYIVLAAAQKSRRWLTKALQPKELRDAGKLIANMAQKVKLINEEKIRTGTEVLQFQSITQFHVSAAVSAETKAPRVEGGRVTRFEGPKERLKELLVHGEDNLQVITLAGMSGLGKSTLAKMVYNDSGVSNKFMIRAFVNISNQFNKKEVLLQLLTSVSGMNDEVMKMKAEELEKRVCNQLAGKQYLIVLDDVWEPEDWNALKSAFPDHNKRCRVLITTRNAGLAKYANPGDRDSLYLLDFLTVHDSKELLKCKVFGQDTFPDEIIEYVNEIVLKCGGLPLAIVLIAGILLDRRHIASWWKEVSGSVYNYLSRDASEGNKLVEMMYEHLPNKLKPCFIYLGVFREDYEIPVWKLVRLWISEGFIQGGEKTNLEDIAEQYLEELVQRNLVIVEERRSNGKIKTCRLHDALREFCKKEADEENLFQEVNRQKSNLNTSASLDNCRRLCNDSNAVDFMSVSGKRIRSFLTFQKELPDVQPKHTSFIIKTFKLLKVLEADSLRLDVSSPDLSHLVLLKYLTISSNLSTIPSALSELWNLQTLIVTTTSTTLKVEMNLWILPHFRHFHTNSAATLPSLDTKSKKSELDSLETNVRTLCTISTEGCSRKVFDRTPRLKKLGIRGDIAKLFESIGDSDDKSKSKFGELRELENLKFTNNADHEEQLKLQCLPSHTCFPPGLTMLTLTNTRLEWKEMSKLGKLVNLEVLKLKEFAFQGKSWKPEERGFVNLVHLYIGKTDLVSWNGASAKMFPKLETLKLKCCDRLKALPHGFADFPSLRSLDLHSTNPDLALSARKLLGKLNQARQGSGNGNKLSLSIYPPSH